MREIVRELWHGKPREPLHRNGRIYVTDFFDQACCFNHGNLLIGKAYTALLDLKPGDEFEIKLGRKQIRLIPAGSADEDEE